MDKSSASLFILFTLIVFAKCEHFNSVENILANTTQAQQPKLTGLSKNLPGHFNSKHPQKYSSDVDELRKVIVEYVEDVINRKTINLMPGIYIERKVDNLASKRFEKKSLNDDLITTIKEFTDRHTLRIDLGRATTETGRLFFFKGKYWTLSWHEAWE